MFSGVLDVFDFVKVFALDECLKMEMEGKRDETD